MRSMRPTTLLALVCLTAGCLAGGPGVGPSPTPATKTTPLSPATSPTPTTSPSPATPATTSDGITHAANEPDPDKAVELANEWNRSVEMQVRVIREATNETVHNETYELASGTERTVYNTAKADPDGIESFTVVVTARNETMRITIETNQCYGGSHGTVQPDGTPYLFYAIC